MACGHTNDPFPVDAVASGGGGSGGGDAIATTTGGGGATMSGAGGEGAAPAVVPWETPPPDYCSACTGVSASAPIQSDEIDEASGLGASSVHPGAWYTMNDSGDVSRFFALTSTGEALGEYTMQSSQNDDFEDMAMGPCSTGQCLYIADIGDNDVARPFYTLYRVTEPTTLSAGVHTLLPTRFTFDYGGASHNAETLLIHPTTGEIAIVTRTPSGMASEVFSADEPLQSGVTQSFGQHGTFKPPHGTTVVTGGDVHPAGHGILIRTYDVVLFYPAIGPEESVAGILSHTPCALPSPVEPKGEAVAWNADGTGYSTLSERGASNPPLNHVTCTF